MWQHDTQDLVVPRPKKPRGSFPPPGQLGDQPALVAIPGHELGQALRSFFGVFLQKPATAAATPPSPGAPPLPQAAGQTHLAFPDREKAWLARSHGILALVFPGSDG